MSTIALTLVVVCILASVGASALAWLPLNDPQPGPGSLTGPAAQGVTA
ncbi:MAG: hypothetical protein ACKVQR_23250 [Aquabacterium sp.]